jgi:protein-S-isoprenylcysteine O-methyltransferase Ste14
MTETVKLNKYGINTIARHVFTGVITGILLFVAAGSFNWTWGWIFSIVYVLCWIGLSVAVAQANPHLMNERGKPTKEVTADMKSWDKVLLGLYTLLLFAQPIVAGLDWRNGWSAPMPNLVYVLGNVIIILSFVILAWSMMVNQHFEPIARIQTEKHHKVISGGPYAYVRHPGYVAVILNFIGLPLALGSWYALLLGIAGSIIYVIRTALEDKMLRDELDGYAAFAQSTRYRLLPGVW